MILLRNATKSGEGGEYMELKELKTLLFNQKKTYREIASRLNMGTNTFSNKLNGKTSFTVREIEKLVEILNLSPDDIVKYFFPNLLHFCNKNSAK